MKGHDYDISKYNEFFDYNKIERFYKENLVYFIKLLMKICKIDSEKAKNIINIALKELIQNRGLDIKKNMDKLKELVIKTSVKIFLKER